METCGACKELKPCKKVSSWAEVLVGYIIGFPVHYRYLCKQCLDYREYLREKERNRRINIRKEMQEEFIKRRDKTLKKIGK